MTTFTTQKSHILRFAIVAIAIAVFNLLQPVKIYAQNNKTQCFSVNAIFPVTATVTFEADPDVNEGDISGKLSDNNQPSSNFVLPPPPNDNCATAFNAAYTLTAGSAYKCGTLANATVEPGENTACFTPAPVGTVWFSFIAVQPAMWIAVKPNQNLCGTVNGTVPSSFGLAVYQSTTCLPTVPVACLNYYSANNSLANWSQYSKLNLTGLTPGLTYMVQIAVYASCTLNTWKPYCIKIGNPSTCNTCANACGSMCIQQNWPTCCNAAQVAFITANCPGYALSPPLNQFDFTTNCYTFTAVNDTMWLNSIIQAYCNPNTYSFTYTLYNDLCGQIGPSNVNVFANNRITNLNVGTTYRICYSLQSACSWDSVWPFGYTTGQSTLPVELVSFGAKPVDKKVEVSWTTASEENCKEFIVERSSTGQEFREIARMEGAGNSTTEQNYKLYDHAPAIGRNYYRLKQIDFNGKFAYSTVIALVTIALEELETKIIPNPTSGEAKAVFKSSGKFPALIKVIDMQGKEVLNSLFTTVEGMNEYSLNMSELPKGIYSVQLIVDDQNMISKLVKE
ncbi:MAG TPA: T9SS type A sorting domain-containing protein [Bacteroidia bacterium]|nr:T9SS type A sorting domain-containing protein [Bacteroidia bacterium]